MIKVPFNDLYAQYLSIKDDIDHQIESVIRTCSFIRGEPVERFEAEFAIAVAADHCVSCGNGTDALYISMKALGVSPGDEVIVPAESWISTSETVTQAGARVVFCDTNRDSLIDHSKIEDLITENTVGIIPVHLYGNPCDMDAIMRLADKYGLWVIEDCAQAHFAKYKGDYVGTFGNAATWSFYPGKNLGAMGDAGAITTSDNNLAIAMARFARHGGLEKGEHLVEGINSRMDGIQAAILSAKLPHLHGWTERRRRVAERYKDGLAGLPGLMVPHDTEGNECVWHLFVVKVDARDELKTYLAERGIATAIQYPVALPFLPAYAYLKSTSEEFPIASRHQKQILSLPIFAEISDRQVNYVIDTIKGFFSDE